jgi:hypothetical protein
MNEQHTPGPWSVHGTRAVVVPTLHLRRPLGGHEDARIDRETYAQEICALHWPDRNRSEDEVQANAHLIAAAPELLEIAEMVLPGVDAWGNEKQAAKIRAVIAKALGSNP